MTRRSTIMAVCLVLLAVPMLCSGGIAQHHDHDDHEEACRCEEDACHCEHDTGCPLDPCQTVIIIQKAPDNHINDLGMVLRACPITTAGDDDVSIIYRHSHLLTLLLQNLPFPKSDVPLLIWYFLPQSSGYPNSTDYPAIPVFQPDCYLWRFTIIAGFINFRIEGQRKN